MLPSSLRVAAVLLLALACPALADTLDCSNFVVDDLAYDLTPLGGLRTSSEDRSTPPSTVRTSYGISLCEPLPYRDDVKEQDQCPKGTRICVSTINIKEGEPDRVVSIVPVAGPELTVSARKGNDKDQAEMNSIILTLGGGTYIDRAQEARIRLRCNPDAPKSSPFDVLSWSDDVLSLQWNSAAACAKGSEGSPSSGSGNEKPKSRSLFGQFLMLLFVGFLIYLVVGIWIQRSQYGASGWDMVPNRDMWRDLPYVVR